MDLVQRRVKMRRMGKKSTLTSVLLAVVLLGAGANVLVFFRYLQVLNAAQRLQLQAQQLQIQAAMINRNYAVTRSLAAESLELARRNPGLSNVLRQFTPLLQRFELVAPNPPVR